MSKPAPQSPVSPQTNGLAVASLVLGILSVTGLSILTGIPAIVTGAMGLKRPEGKGMSIAGIIMGAISVIIALLFLVFIVVLIGIGAFANDTYDAPNYDDYDSSPTRSTSFRQRI
jgi:hypothetical protein